MANQTASKAETEIRSIIENYAKAIENKDIDTILASYGPNPTFYDLHSAFQYKSLAEYRKTWEECFENTETIKYDIKDLTIEADINIAFAHFAGHMATKSKNSGKAIDTWLRITVCYKKIDGKWLSTHDHCSVPIDCLNDKPMWNEKP